MGVRFGGGEWREETKRAGARGRRVWRMRQERTGHVRCVL